MGVLARTLARLILYGAAALSGIVASLLLARKLEPSEYSLYQTLMKRLYSYVNTGQGLLQLWLYRAAAARRSEGLLAGILASAATAAAGLLAGYVLASSLGLGHVVSLLAGAALAATLLWPPAYTVLDAVRPLRSAAAALTLRLSYGILVAIALYALGAGLAGALAATMVAYIVATAVAYRWALARLPTPERSLRSAISTVARWAKASYSTALLNASNLVYSLDVALAYATRGPLVVAGFFASTALFNIVSEVMVQGLRYLHSYTLTTSDASGALRATRLTVMLAAPLLTYAAAHSVHYVYLLNPAYAWAAPAASLAAYAALAAIVATGFTQTAYGLVEGGALEAAKGIARVNVAHLAAATAYVVLAGVALTLASDNTFALLGWAAALIAFQAVKLILLYPLMPSGEARKTLAKSLILYPLAALVFSILVPPLGPPTSSFWETLRAFAPSGVLVYAAYAAALLLVDAEARGLMVAAWRRVQQPGLAQRLLR